VALEAVERMPPKDPDAQGAHELHDRVVFWEDRGRDDEFERGASGEDSLGHSDQQRRARDG
jgi:hypothetical protein